MHQAGINQFTLTLSACRTVILYFVMAVILTNTPVTHVQFSIKLLMQTPLLQVLRSTGEPTPGHSRTYLFDLIPNDALKGKVVGIIATGGSDHHYLSIEHQFKPLFGYFNAYTIPGGVYANNTHFSNGELVDENILNRLKKLSKETVRLSSLLNQNYKGPDQPLIKRESLQLS